MEKISLYEIKVTAVRRATQQLVMLLSGTCFSLHSHVQKIRKNCVTNFYAPQDNKHQMFIVLIRCLYIFFISARYDLCDSMGVITLAGKLCFVL